MYYWVWGAFSNYIMSASASYVAHLWKHSHVAWTRHHGECCLGISVHPVLYLINNHLEELISLSGVQQNYPPQHRVTHHCSKSKSRAWKKAWLLSWCSCKVYRLLWKKGTVYSSLKHFFFLILDVWTERFWFVGITAEAEVRCERLRDACGPNEKQVQEK